MAISINLGSGAGSTNGDTLYDAFTKINNMFTTTTKLGNGDLNINGVNIGKANNYGSTAVGDMALNVNTVNGNDNTAVGWSALSANTNGIYNTALGSNAMRLANGAIGNTAVGMGALRNSTGQNNTAIGLGSLERNQGGENNTAVGNYASERNLGGIRNTSIGVGTLYFNQSGSYNTALGSDALANSTTHSYSTGVGHNANVQGSYEIQLGNGATTCYTNGAVQNRSDLRDKTEVRDTVLGLDFINELRPVDYKWDMREDYISEKPIQGELSNEDFEMLLNDWVESAQMANLTHDGTHIRNRYHHGLIAQEVQDVIEASGVDFGGFQDHKVNGGGDVLSIGYDELIAPMIKAIQELTARINVLEGN